jgi:glucose/arabinose dehydrogenase
LILCHVQTTTGSEERPIIADPALEAEVVVQGLEQPVSMAFLGRDDILVLEKDKGTVQRIIDGKILPEPILDVNVATRSERGMLGIAVAEKMNPGAPTYVFLYYTEAESKDSEDLNEKKDPLGNRLYRYEFVNDKLLNPKLLLDLPSTPGPAHNGGAVTIGPDNNLYLVVGEVQDNTVEMGPQDAKSLDGRGGILRVTQDGKPVNGTGILGSEDPLLPPLFYTGQPVNGTGILGDEHPLDMYYAYGIRNSFGLDFDPITWKLWDTENGPGHGDEINLVEPGFNSGWKAAQGMDLAKLDPNELVSLGGKGKYSDPQFVWTDSLAPTAIKFLDSDKLGKRYENDIFVSDITQGNIYRFDLTNNRTNLMLEGPLTDKISNNATENESVIFAEGFGGVTDMEVGPDGYLYIVSYGQGKIFRIVPQSMNQPQ